MPSVNYIHNKILVLDNETTMTMSGLAHLYYYCSYRQPADDTDGCESKTTWWRLSHLNHLFSDGRRINTVGEIYYSEEKRHHLL